MSATQVPILDPKNMIFEIPGPYGEMARSSVYDPVAKLVITPGGNETIRPNDFPDYDAGGEVINLHFQPRITKKMLETGEYWIPWAQKKSYCSDCRTNSKI